MTTTINSRPEVIFREPEGSSFRESLDVTPDGEHVYTSLACNGCASESGDTWMSIAFLSIGIALGAIAIIVAARKWMHKDSH